MKEAKGDIIAFFDDDAVADKNWIKELLRMYEEKEAIAAGGKLLPSEMGVKGKGLLIVTFSLSVESYSIKFFGQVNPTTF